MRRTIFCLLLIGSLAILTASSARLRKGVDCADAGAETC